MMVSSVYQILIYNKEDGLNSVFEPSSYVTEGGQTIKLMYINLHKYIFTYEA